MDTRTYDEKMKEMLSDHEIYKKMKEGHGKVRVKYLRKKREKSYGSLIGARGYTI